MPNSTEHSKPTTTRVWIWLKRRPYIVSALLVLVAMSSVWLLNKERPFELANVSPGVLAAIAENPCAAEPKWKTLRTKYTRKMSERGQSEEVSVDRVETHLRDAIVLKREQWFEKNKPSPVSELRSFTFCGMMALNYHERGLTPVFSNLLKETGWLREKITGVQIHELKGYPNTVNGVFAYTKTTEAELSADTGLRDATVRPVRCTVDEKFKASALHPRLSGDAYRVSCTSEWDIRTTGGFPATERNDKVKRVTVYHFIEEWGWGFPVRSFEADARWEWTLVDFSVE